MNMKFTAFIIVGLMSSVQVQALSRQQVHIASTMAGVGAFGLLNKFFIQRSCPFAWKEDSYKIKFKDECMETYDGKQVVGFKVKKDLGKLGLGSLKSMGVVEWLLWGYTPDARYKKAYQVLQKMEQIPLCTTKITTSNVDEIMEESDCYTGVDCIPLVNASGVLHVYTEIINQGQLSLKKARNDEPEDTLLYTSILESLKQLRMYKTVIRHNERLVKTNPEWLKAVSVNNSNKISNAQKENAEANASIASSTKWQTFISVLEFVFGSKRR